MKKIIFAPATVFLLFVVLAVSASALTVYMDDARMKLDVYPFLVEGNPYLPAEEICKKFDAKIISENSEQITIEKNGNTVKFVVGDSVMYKNGEEIPLDYSPRLIINEVMVSPYSLGEALETQVAWDSYDEKVYIIKNPQEYILMYAIGGGCKCVPIEKLYAELALGWYEEPVIRMYSASGNTKYVEKSKVGANKENGWYEEPVDRLYALDGRTIVVRETEVKAYKEVGWYDEPVITMYSLDDRTKIVKESKIEAYKEVGWYEKPVVKMYAPDGRSKVVEKSKVEAYKNVGWYDEPVITMYSLDGRTKIVGKSKVEEYKNVGWYEEPVQMLYAHGKSKAFPLEQVAGLLKVGWSETPVSNHEWESATCSSPKKCTICGETEGEKAPHKYSKNTGKCTFCGSQKLLYNGKGITIYFLGVSYEYGNFNILIQIENNGDKKETIQVREESLNNYMADFIMSQDVLPGKKAKTKITIPRWNFGDAEKGGFETVKNVSFKFILCESDYYLTPEISIDF